MDDKYLETWTIREVFNVTDDIYLLPGNRFQIVPNSNSSGDGKTFSIVGIPGALNKEWETCTNLTPSDGPVAFGLSQALNSSDQSRTAYEDAFLTFLSNRTGKGNLTGTVVLGGVSTAVSIYVDDTLVAGRRLIVLSVGSAHQSGTAHGDR
jgi:hypothetical protein